MPQGRSTTGAVAACIALVVTVSCGHESGGAASNGDTVPERTVSSVVTTAPALTTALKPSALVSPMGTSALAPAGDFPAVLVGTWSGGRGKSLAFTAGGRYRSNSPLGEGQADVSGERIALTPDGRDPIVTSWFVAGGRLHLGTSVYIRDDAGSGSLSLVGAWIEANGYAFFRFAIDGTYDFSDGAHGRNSQGTYSVDGQGVTIRPHGRPPAIFGLRYDGTFLTFVNSDGTSAGEYVRVG